MTAPKDGPAPGPPKSSVAAQPREESQREQSQPVDVTAEETVMHPSEQLPDGPKVINFADLARCGNEVWIRNGGQLYRLQQTRQGKLILTK